MSGKTSGNEKRLNKALEVVDLDNAMLELKYSITHTGAQVSQAGSTAAAWKSTL